MFQSYIKGSFLSIFRPIFQVDKKSLDSFKTELDGLFETFCLDYGSKKSKMKTFRFATFSASFSFFVFRNGFFFFVRMGEHFFAFLSTYI